MDRSAGSRLAASDARPRRRLLRTLPAALATAGCATVPATSGTTGPGARALSPDEQRQLDRHLRAATRPASPGIHAAIPTRASNRPLALTPPAREWPVRWRADGAEHDLDAYFARQPVAALLVATGTTLRVQRYRWGLAANTPYLGNSMTKTVTAIAIGLAVAERRIASIDDPAQRYLPALAGSAYGATTVRNLLRMASGVRFTETYEPGDDFSRFGAAVAREGYVAAARLFDVRDAPQGTRFSYASVESQVLGAVLRGATGQGLATWLQPRLWQPMGAAHDAGWLADRTGLESGGGGLAAAPHDWLRLGVLLAHGGVRPDDGRRVLPADWVADMTDATRAEPPFRPDARTNRFGYGYQTWLLPGGRGQFALLGVYGQAMFVDPGLRLVMLHQAAHARPTASASSLARERLALWQGVVRTASAAAG